MPKSKAQLSVVLTFALIVLAACQPAGNSNTNTSNLSTNTNTAAANSNMESTVRTGPAINTREPAKYSATLVFTIETEGREKVVGIPPLSARVARNGADRRVEFTLPDGSPLVYLDHNNRHYVIVPTKKQYAELSPEATGMQLHKLMTPGQLVEDLRNVRGVERVGDEALNGRAAEKYRYSNVTNTNTQAGQVSTEAFVYVDKETGLPLRSELISESSGDVKGVKGARVVVEMRDINTEIDPSLFEVPAGYAQVPPEKIRQQIDALTGALSAALKAMIGSLKAPAGTATPAATASPK
jgi:outer membrane lipoprotein-sorting protein